MKALTVVLVCFLSLAVMGQSVPAKLSPELRTLLDRLTADNTVKVLVAVRDSAALPAMKGIVIEKQYGSSALITINTSQLSSLLKDDDVQFISLWRQPKEELTTGAYDLSLNTINLVHNHFPAINGAGIIASIKEQAFDTTDIDIKGRYLNSGVAAPTESIHASIMATIIGGGANSSPFAKGVAWGSTVTSSDFATLLPDANTVYTNNNIHLQNHSYGTTIENFYGADAAAYDALVWSEPTLVHVFSAGNSGTSSPTAGTYNGVLNYANITGSFKMAKNILTVGHVDSSNQVLPLSSRGPAYDGRVEPQLVAFGEDGSSGAAALVSGSVALLQQAYKQLHNNNYPSAALVKAVLLNSANDIGAKGIDFVSGYGSLNTFNAIQTLNNNRFFEDAISNNQTKTFAVTVPPNASQLKITIAWTDTAAGANASKALVNDVDAAVIAPGGQSFLPWVLNSKPNIDSLSLPAVRAVDTLNNVEQITIDAPQAGNYSLQIKGSRIVTASQAFAVAYEVDTLNSFTWTYPTASDIIKAGIGNYLRWQTGMQGNGVLEYTSDGTNWQTISSSVDLGKNYFEWNAPDTVAIALLRMRTAAKTVPSDSFVISRELQVSTGFSCADSFLLYWNKLPVSSYQVYQLGTLYLQPALTVSDSFHIFSKSQAPSFYYAVAPIIKNKTGLKSYTINYTDQGVGCYVVSFYSLLQNNGASLTLTLGTLYNVAQISFQKATPSGFQTVQSFAPSALVQNFVDLNLTKGVNRYRAQIKLNDGTVLYSDEDQVLYFPGQPVIVFPNPAPQQQPIHIIVKDQGIYSIRLFDAAGRFLKNLPLNDVDNTVPSLILSKGIYFIQVNTGNSPLFVQKVVVY